VFTRRRARPLRAAIVELDPEVRRSGWGYGFGFRDPEGNVWGVAVKYGSHVDDAGGFTYP
jgi:hypothetical protein